jgi:hypothetical protein
MSCSRGKYTATFPVGSAIRNNLLFVWPTDSSCMTTRLELSYSARRNCHHTFSSFVYVLYILLILICMYYCQIAVSSVEMGGQLYRSRRIGAVNRIGRDNPRTIIDLRLDQRCSTRLSGARSGTIGRPDRECVRMLVNGAGKCHSNCSTTMDELSLSEG